MNLVALARLLRLASPALPVGAFGYSQGLEWAVDSGAVRDELTARGWIGSLVAGNMARFELPLLLRMREASAVGDFVRFGSLNAEYLASRETQELRAETLQMGGALRTALGAAGDCKPPALAEFDGIENLAFPAAFAFAAAIWEIPAGDTAMGYAWSWAENQVTAAIKLVPLGQSAGQRILAWLTPALSHAVEVAMRTGEESMSNFAPLYAIASSRHETQYTRLFRS